MKMKKMKYVSKRILLFVVCLMQMCLCFAQPPRRPHGHPHRPPTYHHNNHHYYQYHMPRVRPAHRYYRDQFALGMLIMLANTQEINKYIGQWIYEVKYCDGAIRTFSIKVYENDIAYLSNENQNMILYGIDQALLRENQAGLSSYGYIESFKRIK